MLLGKELFFTINIDQGILPEKYSYNVYCEYSILINDGECKKFKT